MVLTFVTVKPPQTVGPNVRRQSAKEQVAGRARVLPVHSSSLPDSS